MSDETQAPRHAQDREEEDPTERERPVPIIVALITLSVVIFGVAYIMLSEPFGRPELGDRRTVADLRAPAAGAAGAAADGKQVFTVNCVACHQATGKGLPGVFPPLDGSEWVAGDERIVANILLHGINGEITVAGNSFKGAMPAFHQLSDDQVAAEESVIQALSDVLNNGFGQTDQQTSKLIFVQGAAGTGKTVLLSHLFYRDCWTEEIQIR